MEVGKGELRNTHRPHSSQYKLVCSGEIQALVTNGGEDESLVFVKLPPNTPYWDQVLENRFY